MSIGEAWWEPAETSGEIAQADLVLECPIFQVVGTGEPDEDESVDVVEERRHVLVLTQTCDLVNDKVSQVLLAAVVDYPAWAAQERAAGNSQAASSRYRQDLIKGLVPGFVILRGSSDFGIAWPLVIFRQAFTVPKSVLRAHVEKAGHFRMRSPYREHVAQVFARYMMRVALQDDLADFRTVQAY